MNNKPLHERLRCFGYYGFATGYLMPETYCNACPAEKACWERHKQRVKTMLPDIVAEFEKMVAARKAAGQDTSGAVLDFQKKFDTTEPYVTMLLGNIEDGACVRATGKPKDRDDFTLPWPFSKVC